jgi:shikimate dehydrogenase
MHNAALRAVGLEDWLYTRLPLAPERFDESVRALAASGYRGINVTIPHKEAALALAGSATPAARAIGAANTLTFGDDGIEAENTDAQGFLDALGRPVEGMNALILGAGGAARAVAWALREAGAREVSVWNRTPERARRLAVDLGVRALSRAEPADLLVNATSVGLHGSADDLPLSDVGDPELVADLVYGGDPLPFSAWASARGTLLVDGLEVLVRQGALSFVRWTGKDAPLNIMREAVRDCGSRPDMRVRFRH